MINLEVANMYICKNDLIKRLVEITGKDRKEFIDVLLNIYMNYMNYMKFIMQMIQEHI